MKIALALGLALVLLTGCVAGPNYLSNSVRDWQNNHYQENPIVCQTMSTIFPVYPLLELLGWIGDFLVLNPSQFWFVDIWSGEGAPFVHDNPETARDAWFQQM